MRGRRLGLVGTNAAVAIAVATTGGCSFDRTGPDPGAADDVSADATPAPADCAAWVPRHFVACDIPAPRGSLRLDASGTPYTYDTTSGGGTLTDRDGVDIEIATTTVDQPGGITAALLSVDRFEIDPGAQLDIVGAKPLIVAASLDIRIHGTIDAGSHVGDSTSADAGERIGAGANLTCTASAGAVGEDGTSGSGGGGGGAFRGSGTAGGYADSNFSPPFDRQRVGGAGGVAMATPEIVRGGCNGAASGIGNGGGDPASGGAGGGAIQLTARGNVEIRGSVLAGGAGGRGSALGPATGGGGGGSGGYIGMEGARVDLETSVIAANGGAGGGGAALSGMGGAGGDGAASDVPALGGVSTTGCGTTGGAGSAGESLAGGEVAEADFCGGGGGGGGAGYVLTWTTDMRGVPAVASPAIAAGP